MKLLRIIRLKAGKTPCKVLKESRMFLLNKKGGESCPKIIVLRFLKGCSKMRKRKMKDKSLNGYRK